MDNLTPLNKPGPQEKGTVRKVKGKCEVHQRLLDMGIVAIIKRETNSWKWAGFSVAYHTVLAWGFCFIVWRAGKAAGIGLGWN